MSLLIASGGRFTTLAQEHAEQVIVVEMDGVGRVQDPSIDFDKDWIWTRAALARGSYELV